jgi:hypothetical protein
MEKNMNQILNFFCEYYQAEVDKKMTWLVVSTLKSFEHTQFDRTIDAERSVFEFFVPKGVEDQFLAIMDAIIKKGYVKNLCKKENRLKYENV